MIEIKKSREYKYSFKSSENKILYKKDTDFFQIYEVKSINGDTYYYTMEEGYKLCFDELQIIMENNNIGDWYPTLFTDIGEMKIQDFIVAYGFNLNGFNGGLIIRPEDSYKEINISEIDPDYIMRTVTL